MSVSCAFAGALPSLKGCSNLSHVSMVANKLSGVLPNDYSTLESLKVLDLSNNFHITGLWNSLLTRSLSEEALLTSRVSLP